MKLGESGHQDIPRKALDYVRRRIAAICAARGPDLIGITSLAAGADQLFAQAVLDAGGRLHVVVPSEGYEQSFKRDSDVARFRALLARADSEETLAFDKPSKVAYLSAGHRVVDLADEMLVVWDGEPAQGAGGTGDIVEYADAKRVPIIRVWPEGVERAKR